MTILPSFFYIIFLLKMRSIQEYGHMVLPKINERANKITMSHNLIKT